MCLGLYEAGADVVVYDGYDAWQAEEASSVTATLAPIVGSADLLLTIPAVNLTENTVYYISIDGQSASPVYIVTAANAAAVDADNAIRIYAENGQFFSAGQHPSNTCYDGTLIYNNSTLTGGGRTSSTDFFGGNAGPSDNPPERPADLGPSDEPPGGFGGID